ncbi:P-loop containing nucleoside triphosphate hydrolase protein [Rhodofomes roseus]|uniref:P-loop containing nucleoside triphosphate hydrolase protein n=1 Tax=Rhodofomes roseus TaxID=34475 RepID=A0ABQ8KD21_9APHY|nr:P-loop containing nucleoside triphosphate hydrolase protein [Rhodofomes roseus]KAH9835555.1 P-loop containing nucleoside triphosphate hydrolase protein [Rhodofomes roseus]
MRLAFLLPRRSLLMQADPAKRFALPSSSSLKRPFSRTPSPSTRPPSDPDQRPGKVPKVEGDHLPSSSRSTMTPSSSSSRRQMPHLARAPVSGPSRPSSNKGRRGKAPASAARQQPTLPEPVCSEAYIRSTYETKPIKAIWNDNPKSPLTNHCKSILNSMPEYESVQGIAANGQTLWRTTVRVKGAEVDITGCGDHSNRKDSEKLAALSALLQLDTLGAFNKSSGPKQPKASAEVELSPTETTLSDGSKVDYEKARQFMEYYCRRFGFGRPELTYTPFKIPQRGGGTTAWQAEMTVDGRRIGFSKGSNKKNSMLSCYVDVTQYLEQCDPNIWAGFLKDQKTGKDLGLAPRVLFEIEDSLQDHIADLCSDIKKSKLYQNRSSTKSSTQDDGDTQGSSVPTGPRLLYRRPVPFSLLQDKSARLKQKREEYLASTDPKVVRMREQRAGLPVYTKSEQILQHIENHEVTICMAATGSGKTTQIPQIILDNMIDRGEGAKCNIVCTQPRRIAAISVADRVAKERSETVGRNSCVGYQVRFEHNLPEEHGSVTFCTTGIFLKRMQSALEGDNSAGRSLDDVTHILVDEVHERDVDTDLLLVVLKRMLADRKARNKPLKVVLMSATIDAKLFQEYFPDENDQPASVIEIPGRAFPVDKKFLDEFLPDLARERSTSWVFQQDSVQKYLTHQLGSTAVVGITGTTTRSNRHQSDMPIQPSAGPDSSRDDDLDMPAPLVALTIAHVLRRSEDGHVLVFLPGWDDITSVQKCLQGMTGGNLLDINFNDSRKYSIHLLHSTVPIAEQQAVFEPPPEGVRRIILATNIAETSVTIPDVVYVVDTARVKEQRYDPERHISSLVSAWVGSSNLNQRAGRAGRHRSGEYYGILTRRFSDALYPHQTVEMKRVDLSNVVMHIKALNFPGMTVEEVLAETIEPPAVDRVTAAMKALEMVGALDQHHNLTSLGRVLLQIPVDVQMGRLVLYGSFFRCLDQALTLAAILTNRDPFLAPMHLKFEAAAKKNSFTTDDFRSDALATLRAYNQWWEMQSKGMYVQANRFCQENFLAKPTLIMIQKIKDHLLQSLYSIGVIDLSAGGDVSRRTDTRRGAVPPELNSNGESQPLLAALIAIASQPKFAIRTGEKIYRTATDKRVFIHPSSVNHRRRERAESEDLNSALTEKQIIAYTEKRQNLTSGQSHPDMYLITTSRLDPLTYILFGAFNIEVTFRGLECDEWLPIVGRQDALDDVERLKRLMEACMLRVFEGIIAGRSKANNRRLPQRNEDREDESGDEDDSPQDRSLSAMEVKELDVMTRDIVRILNEYGTYRVAMQSQHNSRPATPMDSPVWASNRLPGTRSGYSTPAYNMGSAYNSRPSTPSRLSASSRRW